MRQIKARSKNIRKSVPMGTMQSSITGSFLRSMPQLICSADADGCFDYFCERWHELTGLNRSNLQGAKWDEFLHPDDITPCRDAWENSLTTGKAHQIELRLFDKVNGNYIWFNNHAWPVKSAHGDVVRWHVVSTDITEKKKASDKNLKRHVQNEKLAIRSSELKSQFLAHMSHEIRTPLNGIVGIANLLVRTEMSKEQKDYVNLLLQSGQHLQNLVGDVLDLSKIEADSLKLDLTQIDLRNLIKTVQGSMSLPAEEKGLVLRNQIPKDSVIFIGDSTRIKQILVNLVQNAIKFSDHGSIRIAVSAKRNQLDRARLRFEVSDSGIGISKKAQANIFNAYTQSAESILAQFEGTGLGLAVSKKLVQMMNGTIGVKSKIGKGSTFHFEIPVRIVEKKSISALPQKEVAQREKPVSSLNVLVAEDQIINQKLMRRLIEARGHRVGVASNGLEVLAELKQAKYHLILMDCHMPKLDGFSTTEKIRALKGSIARIPIIALSADALPQTKKHCFNVGMDGFLTKPIDFDHLMNEIEKHAQVNAVQQADVKIKKKPSRTVIDVNTLKKLQALTIPGKKDFAIEIVEEFILKMPSRFASLAKSLKRRNFATAKNEAHALKSIAGAIGAVELQAIAENIESAAQSDSVADSGAQMRYFYRQFEKCYARTEHQLSAFILRGKVGERLNKGRE